MSFLSSSQLLEECKLVSKTKTGKKENYFSLYDAIILHFQPAVACCTFVVNKIS